MSMLSDKPGVQTSYGCIMIEDMPNQIAGLQGYVAKKLCEMRDINQIWPAGTVAIVNVTLSTPKPNALGRSEVTTEILADSPLWQEIRSSLLYSRRIMIEAKLADIAKLSQQMMDYMEPAGTIKKVK